MSVRFPEVYGTISCTAVGACLIYQSDPQRIKRCARPPPLFYQPSSSLSFIAVQVSLAASWIAFRSQLSPLAPLHWCAKCETLERRDQTLP
jgi:hypothetical protein